MSTRCTLCVLKVFFSPLTPSGRPSSEENQKESISPGIPLPVPLVEQLCSWLSQEGCPVRHLSLKECQLDNTHASLLARTLLRNSSVEELELDRALAHLFFLFLPLYSLSFSPSRLSLFSPSPLFSLLSLSLFTHSLKFLHVFLPPLAPPLLN